jgi:hypothetical protein
MLSPDAVDVVITLMGTMAVYMWVTFLKCFGTVLAMMRQQVGSLKV